MAFDFVVQRLQIGDVILLDLPDGSGQAEAKVTRPIDRSGGTVVVTLRVEGSQDSQDMVREWALDDLVTVVRGP
jgi:Mrp family chromosome partitioning ATPase